MIASVFKSQKNLYFSSILFIVIFVSVYFVLNTFFNRVVFEQVLNWREAESVNLAQGNILSSVTKFQRVISKSSLISGVQVFDENGLTLLKIGNCPNINFSEVSFLNGIYQNSFLFNSRVGIKASGATIIIFAKGTFLYLILLIIVLYLLIISFFYSRANKQVALLEQKVISDSKIQDLTIKSKTQEKIFTLSQKLAHDIRSPISTLNLISARIEDPDLKSLQQAVVQQINDIANDLLNESKNETKQSSDEKKNPYASNTEMQKTEPTQFLTKMLKNLEKEYQFKALAISQKVIFEINYTQIETNFSTQKLTSVIYACVNNFVQNAIEATPSDGVIKITAGLNLDQKIEIAVCDNGKGIPAHILKRLGNEVLSFGKDKIDSTEIKSGNGIALYNASKELQENGAKLVITSIENEGTEMRVVI